MFYGVFIESEGDQSILGDGICAHIRAIVIDCSRHHRFAIFETANLNIIGNLIGKGRITRRQCSNRQFKCQVELQLQILVIGIQLVGGADLLPVLVITATLLQCGAGDVLIQRATGPLGIVGPSGLAGRNAADYDHGEEGGDGDEGGYHPAPSRTM